MDETTRKMLTIVVFFTLITKLYNDINNLINSVPLLYMFLSSGLSSGLSSNLIGSIIIHVFKLIILMISIIESLIMPIALSKYVILRHNILHSFTQYIVKPQIYCAFINIIKLILNLLLSYLIHIF